MSLWKKLAGIGLAAALSLTTAFGVISSMPVMAEETKEEEALPETEAGEEEAEPEEETTEEEAEPETEAGEEETEPEVEKNGEIYILFTSDIHCGINQGFGFAGLKQVMDRLESQGYTVILADDGDAIQGDVLGILTKGEAMIDLMNEVGYDVSIPGNHEFDYGMDRFLELAEKADHPYISCNFVKDGELVFDPYTIIEEQGIKIAFVGITTPTTVSSSTPKYFQDEDGNFIYGFLQDKTGESVYEAVQDAVDSAREEGADYVYILGHCGNEANCAPWNYVDIISNTSGIDVFLDGHSHDTDQVVMKNKDGEDVVRSACGTKMSCIGYSHIVPEEGIVDTGIWSWPNKVSAPELLGIQNEVSEKVDEMLGSIDAMLNDVVAESEVELTIYDPVEVLDNGQPVRVIRRAETNLGDFCADAFRAQTDADIAIVNGGGIRVSIGKGDVTYGDIIRVMPFLNGVCVIEATGQQILDALEWGARAIPGEFGGFFQVSGLSYTVDVNVESACKEDEIGMFSGFSGEERRVSDVYVGDEPIDPEKTYTVAGTNYVLLNSGDGNTAFNGCTVLQDNTSIDSEALIDYIKTALGGVIGEEYADPYGEGRITIIDFAEEEDAED